MSEMKYKLGDVIYWVESGTHHGKLIPCPMCFGKFFVTLILGDGSQEKIECGFCSHGIDRPSGQAKTWEAHAEVKSGAITGFSSKDSIRYEVGYKTIYAHEVIDDEKTAELVKEIKLEEAKEQAAKWFRDSFVQAKKKQLWSAGYHRSCIERQERTIEWHKLRLGMIAEKKTQPPRTEDRE